MKKILVTVVVFAMCAALKGQVLFSDKFNTLTLQNDVQVIGSKTITTTYTNAPVGYDVINDGFKNNVGSNNAPNKPFNVAALKTTGWAVLNNTIENDTFLVTTSWLDTTAATKRFIVTPFINNIASNSVLSWEAKSPDVNYPEGYEVYVITSTGTLSASSFALSDRVFYLADGNTSGGGEKSVWTKRGISLANYVGQNIRVAFKNISQNMFQLWIDDIKVENVTNANDAEISAGKGIEKYNKINTNGSINCRITNKGYDKINLLNVNYSIKGPVNYPTVTESFIITNTIQPLGYTDLTFSSPYNISTPGYYTIKVYISGVNSLLDPNKLNDTIYAGLSIMTSAPAKAVLAEQFLSAFDGNSPDGQEKLAALTASNVIAVNIHDGDSLKNASAAGIISAYRKKTTAAVIDRNYFFDISSSSIERTSYATRINQRKAAIVPATISVTNKNYNTSTRELTFTVSANFVAETMGDYRINAYITENHVSGIGTDTTYNGWNQLSFMYNSPWSPYYQKGYYLASANGYVLNAMQYKHQSVLDTVLDGTYGASGIIPISGGTLNQTYTKVYTYTVPVAAAGVFRFNPDNMYIVANVSEFNADVNYLKILNCAQDKITANPELVSVKELVADAKFTMYPNPSHGLTSILIPENSFKNAVSITIMDVLGKVVYDQPADMRFGLLQLNLYHLENGSYFIRVSDGAASRTQKLIIAK